MSQTDNESMSDTFRAMKEDRQARHHEMFRVNRKTLMDAGVAFKDKGQALLFRTLGRPAVDFYPSTGRWRVITTGKTHSGGAVEFLKWYRKSAAVLLVLGALLLAGCTKGHQHQQQDPNSKPPAGRWDLPFFDGYRPTGKG